MIHGANRSAHYIHDKLLKSVMSCTMRWLDLTPQGRRSSCDPRSSPAYELLPSPVLAQAVSSEDSRRTFARSTAVCPTAPTVGRSTASSERPELTHCSPHQAILTIPIGVLVNLLTLLSVVPSFVPAAVVVGLCAAVISQAYLSPSRSAMREMSNAGSTLYSSFNDVLSSLPSIRAYGKEEAFRQEGLVRLDTYQRASSAGVLLVNPLVKLCAARPS